MAQATTTEILARYRRIAYRIIVLKETSRQAEAAEGKSGYARQTALRLARDGSLGSEADWQAAYDAGPATRPADPPGTGAEIHPGIETTFNDQGASIVVKNAQPISLDKALELANFDPMIWRVKEFKTGGHQVTAKPKQGQDQETGKWLPDRLVSVWNQVWHIKLEPRPAVESSAEQLLRDIRAAKPRPSYKRATARPRADGHLLEIDIADPHLGLESFEPAAGGAWDLDKCEHVVLQKLDELLEKAARLEPIDKILFVFGNDYLHAETVFHTTSKGTPQPDMQSWHHVFTRGKHLGIEMVRRMRGLAPVDVKVVPGNHARCSEFALGMILQAYFDGHDKHVHVDTGAEPYKFYRYGKVLLGFEHGHSISHIRLASLMANERPEDFAATVGGYREWHCGDKHRAGRSSPIAFEEQGVSVEYLHALTPTNEWHKLKGLNWCTRAATGFLWHPDGRPAHRLIVKVEA